MIFEKRVRQCTTFRFVFTSRRMACLGVPCELQIQSSALISLHTPKNIIQYNIRMFVVDCCSAFDDMRVVNML